MAGFRHIYLDNNTLIIMKKILISPHCRIDTVFPVKPGMIKFLSILDTDANNELDDQHAIAYLIFNDDLFDIRGITTNRTWGGGPGGRNTPKKPDELFTFAMLMTGYRLSAGQTEIMISLRQSG